jgi:hypothetical protein
LLEYVFLRKATMGLEEKENACAKRLLIK